MKKTFLVQPRHIYAPPEGEGHIYSPTSLWTIGSKLIQAGADVTFADENIRPADLDGADVIGANLLGAPYIPVVRDRFREVMEKREQTLMVGGQVVNGLTQPELAQLFSPATIHGANLYAVAQATDIPCENLIPDAQTSLVPAYEKISDDDMREYLDPSREISFFLGQGCKMNCDFCGADRKKPETYRKMKIIENDLLYLTKRAEKLGFHQLNMYLSNLDIFQTPEKLGAFASIVNALRHNNPGFNYQIRGLAITTSVVKTRQKMARVLRDVRDAGLHTVGLGVDGGNDETRKNVHKGFVKDGNVLESMAICQEYGMTPETIMVFGHPTEKEESLKNAVILTEELQKKFGAVPRPHVAKDLIPGNKYWNNTDENSTAEERRERAERKQYLFEYPQYFPTQDFKDKASSLSHSDPIERFIVNKCFEEITNMSGNTRELIYPIAPEFSEEENARHAEWNIGRYDR